MNLKKEYERSCERNEPENLQNVIIKFVRFNIKSMYHKKIIASFLDKHAKNDMPYTAESEYELEVMSKDKDEPWGVAAIYHPTQNEKHNKL